MTSNTGQQAFGRWGEEVAVDYLVKEGWIILDRNWRSRDGELDIVAIDRSAQALVAVEVKTRRGSGFGAPLEAITARKLERLKRLLLTWMLEHKSHPPYVRIDAIGILKDGDKDPQIHHVRGLS